MDLLLSTRLKSCKAGILTLSLV